MRGAQMTTAGIIRKRDNSAAGQERVRAALPALAVPHLVSAQVKSTIIVIIVVIVLFRNRCDRAEKTMRLIINPGGEK
jgi:hypothetical protein